MIAFVPYEPYWTGESWDFVIIVGVIILMGWWGLGKVMGLKW